MAAAFDLTSIFWIFLILAGLQPLLRQKALEMQRMRLIRAIEKKRQSRVIALVHRQETMSFLGFPIFRYIDIHDSEQILRAIKLTGEDVPIDMILHTPGGLVLAAEQIAHALSRHKGKVTVFVPHYAMSGGTLLALAADEIVMDDNAVLGPVDPQLGEYPAVSILSAIRLKDKNEVDDRTLILADIAQKAITQMQEHVFAILRDNIEESKARDITIKLTSGRWTHDYPIMCDKAREFGLPISCEMPPEILQLMNLFPQPRGRRPSVQYIPVPYEIPRKGREK
jgi:ClpP class serine protease